MKFGSHAHQGVGFRQVIHLETHRLKRIVDYVQHATDIGLGGSRRKAVMARATAVIVEVHTASRRLSAELQHHFAAVAKRVPIVFDRLARTERQTEAATVSLEAARRQAASSDVIQSGGE